MSEITIDKNAKQITFTNNGICFSQFGIANEILDLIENQTKEIERLKKREQECIDHYLVQRKYASEMEDKYITANNIINELEKMMKNYLECACSMNENGLFNGAIEILEVYLDKLKELKGSESNE